MSNISECASPEDSQSQPEGAGATEAGPGFRAVLTPYRSLSPRGFLILMVAIGVVSFATGLVFLMMGAWPVMAFCGLDVALIYIAFKLNYRAARMHESVHLTEQALLVKRLHPNGQEESWTFNPYWVRLSVEENEHTERTQLSLRSHGRELVIGHFLSNEEKADFAAALGAALQGARGGASSA